jgi:Xaa-Pro aminopeptidase
VPQLNAGNARVGVDGRMISYQKATALSTRLAAVNSKLHFPVQNLVDFVWRDRPMRSNTPIFVQPPNFAGEDAISKIDRLREWIASRPADKPSYSRGEPKPSQMHVGTVITALNEIGTFVEYSHFDILHHILRSLHA